MSRIPRKSILFLPVLIACGESALAPVSEAPFQVTLTVYEADNTIVTRRSDGSSVGTISCSSSCGSPRTSPDGGKIAYILARHDSAILAVATVDGSGTRELSSSPFTTIQDSRSGPVSFPPTIAQEWSSDSRIAFLNGSALQIINADGSNRRTLFTGDHLSRPKWGPGDSTIIVSDVSGALISVNTVTGASRPFAAPLAGYFSSYAWSPDGQRVASLALGDGGADKVVLIDPRTGSSSVLANRFEMEAMCWSPDSRSIAFVGHDPSTFRLFLYQAHIGSSVVDSLTEIPNWLTSSVAYSPDGKSILYRSTPDSVSGNAGPIALMAVESATRSSHRVISSGNVSTFDVPSNRACG